MDTFPGPGPVLDEEGCGQEGDLLSTQDKVTMRTRRTSCCFHVQLLSHPLPRRWITKPVPDPGL